MGKTISPAQAARRSGLSRWTIVRSIQESKIKAFRDNRNHWQIDENSLDDWCNSRSAHSTLAQGNAQSDNSSIIRVAELEVETRMLRSQLEETKQDRDAWKEHSERLANQPKGLLSLLFKRSK